MMYCQDCVGLLADYLDGTLPEEQRRALEEHLSYCPPCVTFVRTYKATSKVARKALEKDVPADMVHRLHALLHDRIKKGS